MFLRSFRENDDVIQIDNAVLEMQFSKARFHESLKSGGGIGEPEWHVDTLIES